MPLEWSKEYILGIKEIDDQHKQFVNVLSELYDAINERKIKTEVEKIFSKLKEYSGFHFETEEKYFKMFNYEKGEEHEAEHEKFRKKMANFEEQYKKDEFATSFELTDFLEDWLLDHVNDMDKEYVQCFHDHGLY